MVVGRVDDVPVPQGIVGKDVSAGPDDGQNLFIDFCVGTLVAVDESHIEHNPEFWGFFGGITDAEVDPAGHRRPLDPRSCEVLHLIVDFIGIEFPVLFQSFGHADGRIAAECPHLEDVLGVYHVDEHLQKPSLKMSACHSSVNSVDVRCTIEAIEVIAFGVDVGGEVGVAVGCCHL